MMSSILTETEAAAYGLAEAASTARATAGQGGDAFQDALWGLPSIMEMWPILAIVVLLFGARKLPELARAMGSSVTQFRRGLETPEDDLKSVDGAAEDKAD